MLITDDNVSEELRAHNPDALAFLIRQFTGPVSALAARILAGFGTPEDVEECTSDVFVAAWNRAAQYDESRGSLRTWLLILTKYQALDTRRRLTRQLAPRQQSTLQPGTLQQSTLQPGTSTSQSATRQLATRQQVTLNGEQTKVIPALQTETATAVQLVLEADSEREPVVAEVLARERQRQLMDVIHAMAPNLREVFVRRYFLHTSIEELATTFGISRSAVDNRLWRARKWLREQLNETEREGGNIDHGTRR